MLVKLFKDAEPIRGMITSIKQNYHAAMTARWKAGEFDGLFGAFKTRGVMLKPPPKIYVEQP